MSLVDEAWMSQAVASEPWAEDASLYQPLAEQILINDNAASLSVQAFLRMCNLKTQVVTLSNAEHMDPSGRVPVLHCGNFVISEPVSIINFIKHKGLSLNEELPEKDKQDLQAYTDLVNNIFVPAELFITWLHDETLKKITYKRYGHPHPWPLNHFLCWKKGMEVSTYLDKLGWNKRKSSLTTVGEEVDRCCQALSRKLGRKPYFFGDKPTELDALVFGHLYTLLTTKLPDNRFAETVKTFDNLVQFCKGIDARYFGKDYYISGDA